jgi:hypothetical protein
MLEESCLDVIKDAFEVDERDDLTGRNGVGPPAF